MKNLFVGIMIIVMVVGMVGCMGMQPKKETAKIYTAYNIWAHSNMKCINYKYGEIIPVGTELKSIKYILKEKDHSEYISLKLVNGKNYVITFNQRWHKGKSMKDYVNYLSTNKTFNELTEGMYVNSIEQSDLEIAAIKQGKIVVGMSKEAVLLSYGIPPEHRTPDLKSNKWMYWMNKRKHKLIYFFDNKAVTRHEYNKLNNELIIKNTKEL